MLPAEELAAAQDFWQMPDDELGQLTTLSRQADRVELKFIVPEAAHEATCAALGVDFADVPAYRVYYLDTADRKLYRHGVVIRLRSVKRGPGDSVVKLRPVSPSSIPAGLRQSKRFVVEVDAMPGSFVCSGALKARLRTRQVKRAMTRGRPRRALFSKAQLKLLESCLPAHVRIDDLTIIGPVAARRRKLVPDGFDHVLLVEQWTFPDGSRILELSARCRPDETLQISSQLAAVLRACGVDRTCPQQTKTSATLDFFSSATPGSPARHIGRQARRPHA